MECDRGTRGQPASDGSRQGFFGGVRRCTERATNIYAGQGGESPSGELLLSLGLTLTPRTRGFSQQKCSASRVQSRTGRTAQQSPRKCSTASDLKTTAWQKYKVLARY